MGWRTLAIEVSHPVTPARAARTKATRLARVSPLPCAQHRLRTAVIDAHCRVLQKCPMPEVAVARGDWACDHHRSTSGTVPLWHCSGVARAPLGRRRRTRAARKRRWDAARTPRGEDAPLEPALGRCVGAAGTGRTRSNFEAGSSATSARRSRDRSRGSPAPSGRPLGVAAPRRRASGTSGSIDMWGASVRPLASAVVRVPGWGASTS